MKERKEKKINKGSLLEKHMTQEKDPKKAQQQRGQSLKESIKESTTGIELPW